MNQMWVTAIVFLVGGFTWGWLLGEAAGERWAKEAARVALRAAESELENLKDQYYMEP